MKYIQSYASLILWSFTALVVVLAIVVWGGQLSWQFSDLSLYQIFPLLGLLAYSLMLLHYPSGILKRLYPRGMDYKQYFRWTSRVVLILLLLHPGLLLLQRYNDGFGLPPNSYLSYVGEGLKIFVMFGVISWFVFMLFEFKKFLDKKSWWPIFEHINNAAMILVWIHAFKLGSHMYGWYKTVWIIYGLVLVASLLYLYTTKPNNTAKELAQ